MKHAKRWAIAIGLLLVLTGTGISFWWGTQQTPQFYREVAQQVHNPVVRKQVAREFTARTQQLADEIRTADHWADEFTEAQINSWLVEEFPTQLAEWIPPGVSEPRVKLQDQTVLVGFRYEQPDEWSGVVSLEVRAWVPSPNRLAIQLSSIKAGVVPLPIEAIVEQVIAQASESGAEIEWESNDFGKFAVVTLAPVGDGEPQLETVELKAGSLRVAGTSKPEIGCIQFEPVRIAESKDRH